MALPCVCHRADASNPPRPSNPAWLLILQRNMHLCEKNLPSRPERSEVEGPAVSLPCEDELIFSKHSVPTPSDQANMPSSICTNICSTNRPPVSVDII